MDALKTSLTTATATLKDVDWRALGDRAVASATSPAVKSAVWSGFAVLGLASVATYAVPSTYHKMFHRMQNLKKKYDAKWALVTGGSSGIGLAIVERLAAMGLNVVVAAYPDKTLEKTMQELPAKYPHVKFLKVPVDLGSQTFLPGLVEATKDLDIQVVFNNAGYITTGFYTDVPLERQLANHNCNSTAAIIITHHYVSLMQRKKLRGCVGFTSSPAGFTPCPFSSIYGATKAYLTEYAMSIAPELYPDGIDVCVVHPSPVMSRFYEGTHALGVLSFFKGTATGPQKIADALIQSMGRTVVRDQGFYPPTVRLMGKLIDINFLADLITATASFLPDFKQFKGVAPPPKPV